MDRIEFDIQRCDGCGLCARHCPGDVIEMVDKVPRTAYPLECWICGVCVLECPRDAITIAFPFQDAGS
jgi:Pyruvate/2-oxoacid:ferredoxin oxidoreductase delta subunit